MLGTHRGPHRYTLKIQCIINKLPLACVRVCCVCAHTHLSMSVCMADSLEQVRGFHGNLIYIFYYWTMWFPYSVGIFIHPHVESKWVMNNGWWISDCLGWHDLGNHKRYRYPRLSPFNLFFRLIPGRHWCSFSVLSCKDQIFSGSASNLFRSTNKQLTNSPSSMGINPGSTLSILFVCLLMLVYCFVLFRSRVSLGSPGCHLSASDIQMLGLGPWSIMPG